MTIDKQTLKALAEAMPELDWDSQFEDHEQTGFCTVYGKPFEIDGQEHEGPIYVERCTAGQAEFIAGAKEAVMALLAEIERLERKNVNQSKSIREYQDLTMGGDVSLGMLKADLRVTAGERDELKAENEALRTGQAIKRLSGHEVREAFNGAYYQARDTGSDGEQCRAGVLAVIEVAMAREVSHD
ncbi:hypothetical protein ACI2JC_21170 [Pseudomonas fulva]|uniref:hypothetical protein n=1 Tax=Pseudomonas fulva TaxID=47880 RepID=UPI00384D8356